LTRTMREYSPDQPIGEFRPLQTIVDSSTSPRRFFVTLVTSFAALGLILAALGIYGVISYMVTRQRQEIGIRMALGADKGDVLRLFIGRELRLVLVGMAAGAAGALILTRTLSSLSHLLYGIGSSDPLTFATVSVVLIGVAALACYIPARRAAKVDPMVALRNE